MMFSMELIGQAPRDDHEKDGMQVDTMATPPHDGDGEALSALDRFLTLFILASAGVGLGLGQLDAVQRFIASTTVGHTNILVAVGLMVMMYPPLAKVRWNIVHRVLANWKLLLLTLVQNWIVGPLAMFLLGIAFFSDEAPYLAGLSLVGCARCIAMVVVWNSIAGGDEEYCAAIVAVNSVLTIGLYSPIACQLINELPSAMGLPTSAISISIGSVAENVGIYMGIPFICAVLTWYMLGKWKGYAWYNSQFTPRIEVFTVLALLLTVLVLFASQSERITANITKVVVAFAPLLIYFLAMFISTFFVCKAIGGTYPQCVALAFTAASNNFELAMAIAIATFGLKSDLALMSVVGATMEIPTMLALVKLSFWLRSALQWDEDLVKSSDQGADSDESVHMAKGDIESAASGAMDYTKIT